MGRQRREGDTCPRCALVCRDTNGGLQGTPTVSKRGCTWEKQGLCPRGLCNTLSQGEGWLVEGQPGWGTPMAAPKPQCQTPRASLHLSEDALHETHPKAADGEKEKDASGCSCVEPDPINVSRHHIVPSSSSWGHGKCPRAVPPALSLLFPPTPQEQGDGHHHGPGCSAAKQFAWRHH